MGKKLTYQDFLKRAKEIHKDKYDYSLITKEWWQENYKNTYSKLPIICKKHGMFYQSYISHIKGKHGCYSCGRLQNIKTHKINKKNKLQYNDFLKRAKEIHKDKYNVYDYSLITKEWWRENYSRAQKTKIPIVCKKHGVFYQTVFDHLQGHGCPKGNESKGEYKIKEILSEYKINFKEQYEFIISNKKLSFDFFILNKKIAIEFDGIFHFKNIFNQLKKQKERDFLKNKYCFIENINLIRIPYWEFDNIEKIIRDQI